MAKRTKPKKSKSKAKQQQLRELAYSACKQELLVECVCSSCGQDKMIRLPDLQELFAGGSRRHALLLSDKLYAAGWRAIEDMPGGGCMDLCCNDCRHKLLKEFKEGVENLT